MPPDIFPSEIFGVGVYEVDIPIRVRIDEFDKIQARQPGLFLELPRQEAGDGVVLLSPIRLIEEHIVFISRTVGCIVIWKKRRVEIAPLLFPGINLVNSRGPPGHAFQKVSLIGFPGCWFSGAERRMY